MQARRQRTRLPDVDLAACEEVIQALQECGPFGSEPGRFGKWLKVRCREYTDRIDAQVAESYEPQRQAKLNAQSADVIVLADYRARRGDSFRCV
jgi:hypothetical protein